MSQLREADLDCGGPSACEFPVSEERTCEFHSNAELQMCEFPKLILHQDFEVYFRFGILNVGGKRCL